MDVGKRMNLIRIINKIEKLPAYSAKLGIKNTSFTTEKPEDKKNSS